MPTFAEISKEILLLNPYKAFEQAMLLDEFQTWIVKKIQTRLYDKGWDGDGKKLRTDRAEGTNFYSDFTLKIKKGKTSNVTLTDTGKFYESFKVDVSKTFFKVEADFFKDNSHIADNFTDMYNSEFDFEDAITKLTDAELTEFLHEIIYDKFIENFKKQ